MKKYATWVLLAAAVSPLVVNANLLSPYIDEKVFFLRFLACVVMTLLTIALLSFRKDADEIVSSVKDMLRDPIFWAVSANMLLLVLSTIFAFDRSIAFFGEPIRGEGFLTLFTIYLLYVSVRLLFRKKEWNTFFLISLACTVILFIIEIKQALLGMIRPSSLFGNPIFLSGYYLFSLFAGYQVWQWGREIKNNFYAFFGITAIVLAGVGILVTKTRGTILSVFVGMVALAIIAALFGRRESFGRFSVRKIGIVICAVLISFSVLFGLTRHGAFWQHVPGLNRVAAVTSTDATTLSRLEYTKASVAGFFGDRNPKTLLLGWGWDNFLFAWIAHYDPSFFLYDQGSADRAHNKLVDVLVMSGLLGLISYLAIWFVFIQKLWRSARVGIMALAGVIFWAAAYFVNNLFIFDISVTLLTFYLLLAFISTTSNEKTN